MAITISDVALAAALRLGDGTTALTEPTLGIVARLKAVSTQIILEDAPDVPDDELHNEAVVRICWAALTICLKQGRGGNYASVYKHSGARDLLSQWRRVRVKVLTDD